MPTDLYRCGPGACWEVCLHVLNESLQNKHHVFRFCFCMDKATLQETNVFFFPPEMSFLKKKKKAKTTQTFKEDHCQMQESVTQADCFLVHFD